MRTVGTMLCGMILVALTSGCAPRTVSVEEVARAMGADDLSSIRYAGTGSMFGFQQSPEPGGPWPRFDANTYDVQIDYSIPAMRLEAARSQGEHPPRGGAGQPIAGERRSVQLVSGQYAWGEGPSGASPSPGAVRDRLRQLWLTPHGLIKAAMASGAAIERNVLPLTIEDQDVTVALNNEGLVEGVEYMVDHPVLGDMPIEITYSDYVDHGGVMFPRRIVEKWGGFPTLDITVQEVEPNAALSFEVPENVRRAPPPSPASASTEGGQEIADGVWYLTIGNPRSVAVEFEDHIVIVEGPSNDAQTLAVMEFMRGVAPDKPIRYVVNTHHHFDHAGGLRAYAANGVTIITHEVNRPFYEEAWARPRTINPDLLARSPREPVFETMMDKKVLTDGSRTMELHHIRNHGHAPGYVMAYLPAERILIYADSYNPPAGDDPRDRSRTLEYATGLYDNIQRLDLDVVTLAPLHGRVVPFDNLRKAIGLIPVES